MKRGAAEGDQLVITRLLPQARYVLDLSQITAEITAKKVDLVVLDQAIDTASPDLPPAVPHGDRHRHKRGSDHTLTAGLRTFA